jgi:hypothetical protein
MVYVGSCCASTMASIGWKIDRPLHLHSLSLATHSQEIGGAIDQHTVLSILLRYGFLSSPALFDAVNIGDGKSAWAYRYTTMGNENKDKNGRQVGFHGVHGNSHCGLAFAGKELADRHVAEEIEMSSGMGAPERQYEDRGALWCMWGAAVQVRWHPSVGR